MNDRQLAVIREVASICNSAAIAYWVRGGWAVDFFFGRITREHEDIDLFAWAESSISIGPDVSISSSSYSVIEHPNFSGRGTGADTAAPVSGQTPQRSPEIRIEWEGFLPAGPSA
jgi:hypothetical protein